MINNKDTIFTINDLGNNLKPIEGEGRKGLLIIVNPKKTNEEDILMLQKMMTAIHHDFNQDLLRLSFEAEDNINISFLGLKFKNLIAFGIKPSQIGYNVPFSFYKPIIFDSIWALFGEDLTSIRNTPSKKQELWNCLKAKFLV